jgi:pilus assembly protein Flp/PilA
MKPGLSMAQIVSRFCKSESGATAIEYALIAGFVSIVIVAAVQGIGTTLNTTFSKVTGAIK